MTNPIVREASSLIISDQDAVHPCESYCLLQEIALSNGNPVAFQLGNTVIIYDF